VYENEAVLVCMRMNLSWCARDWSAVSVCERCLDESRALLGGVACPFFGVADPFFSVGCPFLRAECV